MSTDPIVIIGAAQAGLKVADSLRTDGWKGGIVLIGDEADAPYHRPPLSKDFLAGKMEEAHLPIRAAQHYERSNVEMKLGRRAVAIDRGRKMITLDDGSQQPYAKLALTVGARPRPLRLPGADLRGVYTLRTKQDVLAIRQHLLSAANVVIVGGGFIGLEVAAVARTLGKDVTVLEAQPRLMPRVVSAPISEFYLHLHRQHGVQVLLDSRLESLHGDGGQVTAAQLEAGTKLPASLVIAAIGVIPNDELARESGIDCDNGILVDEFASTSDPDIVAAGDCANHHNPFMGGRLRLESVQNAGDQARIAAATLLGQRKPYNAVPWFWSDQYDVSLQMAGRSHGYDMLVFRGDVSAAKFSAFYFAGDTLIGADSINKPADHILVRRLLAAGAVVTPQHAGDVDFDLKALLTAAKPVG